MIIDSRWIPVSSTVPNGNYNVLIDGGIGYYMNGEWYTRMERDAHGMCCKVQWHVTHWMPIPVLPKEARDA